MSDEIPGRCAPFLTCKNVTIVASCYNEQFTNALVENCRAELVEVLPRAEVQVLRVPGAFEIPVTVKAVATQNDPTPAVIIALGVIIQGSTEHASLVGKSVTQALLNIAVETGVPVVHEVLLLEDEDQARVRCIEDKLNRGREAARCAANMAELFITRFSNPQS
ncbi:MAG: 6,7-dimethyl-8-ribityllumazine synthase [Akkermansia sp.]